MNPSTIVSDFLNEDDIKEVLESVHKLKAHWEPMYGNRKMCMLSLSAAVASSRETPITTNLKHHMMEEFSWLYAKLFETLQNYYSKPARFSHNLNYPGFHIFVGPLYTGGYMDNGALPENERMSDTLEVHQAKEIVHHNDTYNSIDELCGRKIDSLIVPIQLPTTPTGLVWEDDQGTQHDLLYQVGMLGHWSGDTLHSVGNVVCHEGEARITFQLHVGIYPHEIVVFW